MLVVESSGFLFYSRALLDRKARRVDTWAGTRLPFFGIELPSRIEHRALDDFEHLRIFAFWDSVDSDGAASKSFRYAVAIEGKVDLSRLEELHFPGDKHGLILAVPKTLDETHAIATEISDFVKLPVLVPARLRAPSGLR